MSAALDPADDYDREVRCTRQIDMAIDAQELGMALARAAALGVLGPRVVVLRTASPGRAEGEAEAEAAPAGQKEIGAATLTFTRAVKSVREAAQFENHLADEREARRPSVRPSRLDLPRHRELRQVLFKLAELVVTHQAERAVVRRNIDLRLEQEDLDDPELPLGEVMAHICQDLGLPCEQRHFPDAWLGLLPTHIPDPFAKDAKKHAPMLSASPFDRQATYLYPDPRNLEAKAKVKERGAGAGPGVARSG